MRGSSPHPAHLSARDPPPPGEGNKTSFSRCDRIRVLPSHGTIRLQINEGRRSAGRRNVLRAAPHKQMLPPDYARARQRAKRSPLASRRSAAALAKADASTFGSAPDPRFLRPGANGRYPCSPVSSLPRTAGTGRSAGRSGTQSRPGAVCETARGHRTRPANRIASGMHPSRASWLHVTTSGTDVNRSVTPYFSLSPGGRGQPWRVRNLASPNL